MKDETLKELRARAKARGVKGYSKLSKSELLRQMDKTPPAAIASSTPKKKASSSPSKPRKKKTAAAARKSKISDSAIAPKTARVTATADIETTEQRVESAKYALGERAPLPASWADLGEDIENLPALHEPMVCLLPQKPGVLHAYWHLPPRATAGQEYKLRLYRLSHDGLQVYQEIPAAHGRGNHYFHVPENVRDDEMAAQLGYYQGDKFVVAQGRSIARLPSLYASSRTDHRWWISEQEFAEMYLRAGGVVRAGDRYGWSASISSAPSSKSAEQMSWPGGSSSSR